MVVWNAEKDQTILRGIFAFHDIKNSQPFLDFLAKEIGEGCTPKAVSHRLTNLRKCGKPVNSGATPTPKKMGATPRTPRNPATPTTPRTPASGRGRATFNTVKNGADDTTSEDDNDDSEPVASPYTSSKRARSSALKSYAESDAATDEDEGEFTPINKKVKSEPVEEEGAGDAELPTQLDEEDEGIEFV